MRFVLAAVLTFVFGASAFAQQPAQYDIVLSPAQLNLIGTALGKMPYETVHDTVDVIMNQVRAQMAPKVTPKPDAEKADAPKPPEKITPPDGAKK